MNTLKKASHEYKGGHQEVKRIKILLKGSKGQSNYSRQGVGYYREDSRKLAHALV
jgi:F0F1-type ATP synthase gamma subunit